MALNNTGYTTKIASQAVAGPYALDAKYQFDTVTERNAIPQHMRYEGMQVYVKYNVSNIAEQPGKAYYLLPKATGVSDAVYGTQSAHWIEMPTMASSFPIQTLSYGTPPAGQSATATTTPATVSVNLNVARIFCVVFNGNGGLSASATVSFSFSNAVPGLSYTLRILRSGLCTFNIAFPFTTGTASATLSNSQVLRTVNGAPLTLPAMVVPTGYATGALNVDGTVPGANYVQEDIISFMCFEPGKLTAMYMPLITGVIAAR